MNAIENKSERERKEIDRAKENERKKAIKGEENRVVLLGEKMIRDADTYM